MVGEQVGASRNLALNRQKKMARGMGRNVAKLETQKEAEQHFEHIQIRNFRAIRRSMLRLGRKRTEDCVVDKQEDNKPRQMTHSNDDISAIADKGNDNFDRISIITFPASLIVSLPKPLSLGNKSD